MINHAECQEWAGTRWANGGYGRIGNKRAHRVVWEEHHGPIPKGLLVLHHCDNPPCVNIDHLYLGTHEDNTRDRVERDRGTRGESVNTAKLSEAQVYEVRALCDRGVLHRDVAARFDVTQSLVSGIARREIWKRLPESGSLPTEDQLEAQRRQKATEARKKAWTPERRARQSKVTSARNKGNTHAKGRKKSPETRAKMSVARKRWWERKKRG